MMFLNSSPVGDDVLLVRLRLANDAPYIRIFPVWSGYRDSETLKVLPTESYTQEAFGDSTMLRTKNIRTDELAHVSLFDADVFARFSITEDDVCEEDILLEALKFFEQQKA